MSNARKEHPIIFSPPMVRAILDGNKTQTRRVVNPQPKWHAHGGRLAFDDAVNRGIKCPYGQPGDVLWVRETFCDLRGEGFGQPFAYKADSLDRHGREEGEAERCRKEFGYSWKPSIHMPRAAARLFLRVESVRVERLQEITEQDAKAEGVRAISQAEVRRQATYTDRQDFAQLWDAINGMGAPWDSNPWVWVIAFTTLESLEES